MCILKQSLCWSVESSKEWVQSSERSTGLFNEQGQWFELRWLRKWNEEDVRCTFEIRLSGLRYGLGRRREVSRRTCSSGLSKQVTGWEGSV